MKRHTEFCIPGANGNGRFRVLEEDCFGKSYNKQAAECKVCIAPLLVDGRVVLCNEVCAAYCKGDTYKGGLNRLSSNDVAERLEKGASVADIFTEVLGAAQPEEYYKAARMLLYNRLRHLQQVKGMVTPALPPREELLHAVRSGKGAGT